MATVTLLNVQTLKYEGQIIRVSFKCANHIFAQAETNPVMPPVSSPNHFNRTSNPLPLENDPQTPNESYIIIMRTPTQQSTEMRLSNLTPGLHDQLGSFLCHGNYPEGFD